MMFSGNCVALVDITSSAPELHFETWITLDHAPPPALDFQIDRAALTCPFSYNADVVPGLEPAMQCHCADPNDEIGHWARQFVRHGQSTEIGRLLMTLCYAIRESFSCARRLEDRTETPVQTLSLRSGSCRDFALLMMEAGVARSGALRAS